jgi:uncharacterized protein
MLELRPNCECCDKDLAADKSGAFICSFECTFCEACTTNVLKGKCPNCAGELVRRPTRATALLAKAPGSMVRKVKEKGCVQAA